MCTSFIGLRIKLVGVMDPDGRSHARARRARRHLEQSLTTAGAEIVETVDRDTDLVIALHHPGSGTVKAASLGIPCITLAAAFRALRHQQPTPAPAP